MLFETENADDKILCDIVREGRFCAGSPKSIFF